MIRRPPRSTLFPYTTLFRSARPTGWPRKLVGGKCFYYLWRRYKNGGLGPDRKSTRLNSSHLVISYAVFCLKKNGNRQYLCARCGLLTNTEGQECEFCRKDLT